MAVKPPTKDDPQPIPDSDWVWWLEADGWHARREAVAGSFTELLNKIRKAEGGARDGRQR